MNTKTPIDTRELQLVISILPRYNAEKIQGFSMSCLNVCRLTVMGSLLLALANSQAATCPTALYQDQMGFWYAYSMPGWKSMIKTKLNIKVDPTDFAGAIYSPKYQKMTCVYKTSQGKWLAMISEKQYSFSLNNNWKPDPKKNDFICGRPDVEKLEDCQFASGSLINPPPEQQKKQSVKQ